MHPSLTRFRERLVAGEPVTATMFGTSITFGSQVDPARDEAIAFPSQWREAMLDRYVAAQLTVLNRGVPGTKIAQAHERLESVLAERPDLVVVEYGINDCWEGAAGIDAFESGLRLLVERLRVAAVAPFILMTANMLNHRSSPEALKLAWFADKTAEVQTEGWTEAYMECVRRMARDAGLPLADGYAQWEAARAAGVDTDALLANLANHPNREGHRLLAASLVAVFD
jgi:lysophospholipase L1-like esterase